MRGRASSGLPLWRDEGRVSLRDSRSSPSDYPTGSPASTLPRTTAMPVRDAYGSGAGSSGPRKRCARAKTAVRNNRSVVSAPHPTSAD